MATEVIITDESITIITKRVIKREINPSFNRKCIIVMNVGDPLKFRRKGGHSFESQCNRYGITPEDYFKWRKEIDNFVKEEYKDVKYGQIPMKYLVD